LVLRNLQIIGHQIELSAGHLESRMVVNLHPPIIGEVPGGGKRGED
jgi:hypothetical protein